MAVVGAEAGAVVVAFAGLRMKVVVEAVVLALLREVAADREETGMFTTVPGWPLTDTGSWMRSGWPAVIMLLPGAVFSSRVPVGLCVLMPAARLVAALDVEVMSWRMGVCETTALVVDVDDAAVAACADEA